VGLVVVAGVVVVAGGTVVGAVVLGAVVLGVVVAGTVVVGMVVAGMVVVDVGVCGLQTTNIPRRLRQSTLVADAVGAAITTHTTIITMSEHARAQCASATVTKAIKRPEGG
jgi:hypothetical protein